MQITRENWPEIQRQRREEDEAYRKEFEASETRRRLEEYRIECRYANLNKLFQDYMSDLNDDQVLLDFTEKEIAGIIFFQFLHWLDMNDKELS